MIDFRDYQKDIITKGTEMLFSYGFLYLAMEVRTGKTLTSLGICEQLNVENVLFLTKKKAMSSIMDDFDMLCPSNYCLFTINYESMHKIPNIRWDVIICDEAHSMGAFPKPSKRAKDVKNLIQKHDPYVILMSGTPTPESYSQMYHQVYAIHNNPFSRYSSFYKFANDWVNVKQRKINGNFINDYSQGRDSITKAMSHYTINYSQKQAGFEVDTREHILRVTLEDKTYALAKRLSKDLVVEGKEEVILADTAVKLMMKLHQIYSGTIKFESGNSMVIDMTKANFIKERFKGNKIGIFYKFTAELKAIKEAYGDGITTELSEFESTDKSIALQIVSGREGISLRQADALVYYNIDFSATSYWQSRDRMTTRDRLESDVYWIFSERGIEDDIYKAVSKKKTYTVNYFKKDFVNLLG
tara:strand:- start:878 stop:2119 length:1242 start_codon:yes stop_codon:yes gene_type:complete